ncbi:peptidyl-prolyl cis-trans isomerase D isoform X2 [Sitophilus oryzae]|uniref:peptidylprolyl isomerase n=1 Tax=Sitophilus oryzae TaxID=7048 RepID=A0A6J2Y9R8_SITOR|nr:peptidyl-prolyl cis-trans isomerase D isoform X2 [Sitophilus oryzae]
MDNNFYIFFDFTFNSIKAGRVIIRLFNDVVPKCAENLRALCTGEKGIGRLQKPLHYKNSRIHKVIPQCMIQGGDIIKGDGTSGESIYGECFDDENFSIKHDKPGLVGLIRNGSNKNSSQFYITTVPCYHLDNSNVVVGEVIKGLDIIIEMSEIPKCNDLPLQEILIADCGQLEPTVSWNVNENDGTLDVYPPWPNDLDHTFDENQFETVVTNINVSGNMYFKKQSYLDAERKYKKAIRYIDWYFRKNTQSPKELAEFKNKVLLNLTAVRLNINKNKEALENCNEVLKDNPNSGKAYYRRARAKMGLKEYDDALSDLNKAYNLHPTDRNIKHLFDIIKTKKRLYTEKERKFCLKAFSY